MIVHLPQRKKHFPYPTAIAGIKRVDKMNILGITIIRIIFQVIFLTKRNFIMIETYINFYLLNWISREIRTNRIVAFG